MDVYLGTVMLWAVPWVPRGWHLCDGTLLPINANQALFALLGTTYGGDGQANFALPDLRNRVPLGSTTSVGPFISNAPVAGSPGHLVAQGALTVINLPQHTHSATFTGTGGGGNGPLQASGTVSLPFSAPTTVNSAGTAKIAASTLAAGSSSATANAVLATTAGPPAKIYATGTPDTVLGTSTSVSVSGSVTVTGNASGTVTLPVTGATGITGGQVSIGQTGMGAAFGVAVPSQSINFIIAIEGFYPPRS
ncbi:phage tail protein [Telmatospirillum siberiense]|uniref:Phage tail collar domain-containing protein n=1 Tax=Telmatospirillum siberiense TaxID=382514 RepID=A0A2N3PZP5_9PROT|nr:tail fiber protein [Telmatospirillum siberiense]PKU25884.1 hypothetical protein CWS72_04835 [Telmatospirillum siberiense]